MNAPERSTGPLARKWGRDQMAPPSDDPTAVALAEAIRKGGTYLASDPQLVRAILSDLLGSKGRAHRAEVDAVVLAAEDGAPDQLLADPSCAEAQVTHLRARGLNHQMAAHAIATWQYALGQDPIVDGTSPMGLTDVIVDGHTVGTDHVIRTGHVARTDHVVGTDCAKQPVALHQAPTSPDPIDPIGSLPRRIGAGSFDLVCVLAMSFSLAMAIYAFDFYFPQYSPLVSWAFDPRGAVVIVISADAAFGVLLTWRFGGTPGKRIARLTVTNSRARQLGIGTALRRHLPLLAGNIIAFFVLADLRWTGFAFAFATTVGRLALAIPNLALMLADDRRRDLFDRVASTVVVSRRRAGP